MGKLIEEVLTANAVELNSRLNCKSDLLDVLLSQKPPILTLEEKEIIQSKPTTYEQNDALVMILIRKDDRALDVLHGYLKKNGCTELVAALEKSAAEHGHKYMNMDTYITFLGMSATPRPTAGSSQEPNHARNIDLIEVATDFEITGRMVPTIRKYLEESMELLEKWLTIKDDFLERPVHQVEIANIYRNDNSKSLAIHSTLIKWCSLGATVATFNNLVRIIDEYDQNAADHLRAEKAKIRALKLV